MNKKGESWIMFLISIGLAVIVFLQLHGVVGFTQVVGTQDYCVSRGYTNARCADGFNGCGEDFFYCYNIQNSELVNEVKMVCETDWRNKCIIK